MAKGKKRADGEGTVYRRKSDNRWVAVLNLEGGKQKSFYGETQEEALEKRKQAQYEQMQGILATGPKQKVKDYLEYWLEDVHKPTIKESSYTRYRAIVDNHIIPALGHIQLQKLTVQHIQSFYAKKLRDGYSPKTIKVMHAVLHKALWNAVRDRRIPRNLCDDVSLPRATRHEIHPLNLEQIHSLLNAAKDQRLEALIVLALVTGMRRGELLALKWNDLNIAEGSLQVRRTLIEIRGKGIIESDTKNAKGRSISLPSVALEALKHHRSMQLEIRLQASEWQERDFIFCTIRGTPFGATYIIRMFKSLLKKADLPNIRFHDLRHSAATLLLSMGIHPKVVQELLGHSNISMTMDTYSHVMPTMQKDAMIKLDNVLKREI